MPGAHSALLRSIHDAHDLADLRERLMGRASRFFEATRSAVFLFAEFPTVQTKVRDNPVMRALLETHAPLHEALVLGPGQWQALCPRADHEHVMIGPLVQGGRMVGVMAFTRAVGLPPFDTQNLADLSALCLHVSTWLERSTLQTRANHAQAWELSGREAQIVELVAQGLTNTQIGARLCVSSETVKQALKRLFRKTGARSRAQLVALSATSLQEPTASASTSWRNASKSRANAGG